MQQNDYVDGKMKYHTTFQFHFWRVCSEDYRPGLCASRDHYNGLISGPRVRTSRRSRKCVFVLLHA